jgi:hypothetical protein
VQAFLNMVLNFRAPQKAGNAVDLYSRGSLFESRPDCRVSCLKFSRGFPQFPNKCRETPRLPQPSGILCRVVWYKLTDVSEVLTVSIIREMRT